MEATCHTDPSCCGRARSGGLKLCPKRVMKIACTALCCAAAMASAQEPALTAPQPLTRVSASYPAEELESGRSADVLLSAAISAGGAISDIQVVKSGGAPFDREAQTALEKWTFAPARRGEQPIDSTVQVPFRFNARPPVKAPAPTPPPVDHTHPPPVDTGTPSGAPHTDEPAASFESKVKGTRPDTRGASDFALPGDIVHAAPHQSAGDLLGAAPGVYIARPEGDAIAHQVYLRGFDAEHGQDIEFTMGAIPINLPSHIHGQGYADLNLIIPEVVRTLRVTEGVYDPRQGDFAVAGSVAFDLAVEQRGFQSHSSYGSFNTFRELVLWAPRGQPEETFAAVSIRGSDGYGQNRGSLAGNAMAQYAFGTGKLRGVVHAAAYGGRAGIAGVLRLDDVQSGRVGFYDTYPDPSATAQSALAIRAQLGVTLEHTSEAGARTGFSLWFLFDDFHLRENFTGYTQRSIQRPEWVGRGDLIEQENRTFGLGARAFHRTRRFEPREWLSGTFEAGLSLKLDLIDQAQNLLQQPQNQTWDKRVDASVRGADIGLYLDADWHITKYLRLRGGLRADVLYYDIDDRLGNFIPSFMRQTHFVGFRRTALGVAWGPRIAIEVQPTKWLTLNVSYGEGYRSPQARQLEEGENAPFTKVRSVEGGVRMRLWSEKLSLTGAAYATFLDSDLAFDPSEGRLEKIGPTQRVGAVGHVIARPWKWLVGSFSVTYVHATLDAPPPASVENPSPPFTPGQLLPYVPPIVIRLDLGFEKEFVHVRNHHLAGKVGVGFTHLSSRPLPYGQFADPVSLLDISTSLRWYFLELGVQMFNVVGSEYAAVEYSFVSNWDANGVPSRVPTRHITAGPPRTVMGTLGLHF